jgi:hypothetical protein
MNQQMPLHPNSQRRTKIESVPFSLLNREKAKDFHGQTLERLAERGGLSIGEILYNVLDRSYKGIFSTTTDEDVKLFEQIVSDHLKKESL